MGCHYIDTYFKVHVQHDQTTVSTSSCTTTKSNLQQRIMSSEFESIIHFLLIFHFSWIHLPSRTHLPVCHTHAHTHTIFKAHINNEQTTVSKSSCTTTKSNLQLRIMSIELESINHLLLILHFSFMHLSSRTHFPCFTPLETHTLTNQVNYDTRT
jgi:hypothetical protein